jgi:hypothetical protein
MPEQRILQSIFPDVPRESPEVDKDGNFTQLWSLFFGALAQALQDNFKNEGIVFPPLNATNVATIQAIYTPLIGGPLPQNIPDISGQTIFNSTIRLPQQFIISYDASTPPIITSARWWTFTLT